MSGLTWPVVLAVLGGALLHALWNTLIKSGRDKAGDTALIHALATVIALPALAVIGLPQPAAWPYLAASLVVHVAYYIALAGAYHHGELSQTYPIMRGLAPLLVALVSAALIGEAPSAMAWTGIAGVAVGVLAVGLSHPGQALHHGKALGFALANALIIATYTVIDGLGVRAEAQAGGQVMRYVMALFVFDGLLFPLLLWWHRGPEGRLALREHARSRWKLALVGGAASIGSYAVALWAMTRAPVASIAALRETSVLFATALATGLLKERFGLQRALGALLIVAGVMALRLG